MYLRFIAAVKVFAFAVSFANGQTTGQNDAVIDETKVASCVLNNLD